MSLDQSSIKLFLFLITSYWIFGVRSIKTTTRYSSTTKYITHRETLKTIQSCNILDSMYKRTTFPRASSSSPSSLFIQAPLGTSTSPGSCCLPCWQICLITALLCFTTISVKSDASSLWCFVFYSWLSCVSCPRPGHHGGEEVVWLVQHLATPRPAQSPSWNHTHFTLLYN